MLITTYKEANQLQSSFISLPTATVPVVIPHEWCGQANQVRAHDVHLSCVACVCYPTCAHQNCVQKYVHTSVFEVLRGLNMQAHACTCIRVSSLN